MILIQVYDGVDRNVHHFIQYTDTHVIHGGGLQWPPHCKLADFKFHKIYSNMYGEAIEQKLATSIAAKLRE